MTSMVLYRIIASAMDARGTRVVADTAGAACAVRIGREVLTSIAKVPTRRGLETVSS